MFYFNEYFCDEGSIFLIPHMDTYTFRNSKLCKDKSKHCNNHSGNQFSDSKNLLYEHNNTEEMK